MLKWTKEWTRQTDISLRIITEINIIKTKGLKDTKIETKLISITISSIEGKCYQSLT